MHTGNEMKILFVPDWSKGNPYQRSLMNSVKRNNVHVDIDNYCKRWPVVLNTSSAHKDCQVVHLHWLDPCIGWFFWSTSKVTTFIKFLFFIMDLATTKLSGKKIVWTIHNKFMHEASHKSTEYWIRKTLVLFADQVLVHSESAIANIKEAYNLKDTKKFSIVPHGHFIGLYPNTISKAEARKQLGIKEDETVFLHLGSIRPYKGVTNLINAFYESPNLKNAKLILAGKPFTKEYQQELSDSIKEYKNIMPFFEFIAEDKIQVFMNAADVCVFPFDEILTSGSVILAMSFGKAVIVPQKGCLVDLLDKNGAFFFEDSADLSHTLEKCMSADLEKMGANNFSSIKQYNWEMVGDKLTEVYRKVLKR